MFRVPVPAHQWSTVARSRTIVRLLFAAALAVVAVSVPSARLAAQSAADCAALMKFGIYDKYHTFSSEVQFRQVREFFASNTFSTRQDASAKAGQLGLDIEDVLNLTLGGQSSSTSFETWRQQLLQSSYSAALQAGLKDQTIEKISGSLTQLVATCLTQRGLHAYVIPANDNQNFSFTVDYIPSSSTKPTAVGSLSLLPASVAASCAPQEYLQAGKSVVIGPQGVSISCKRLPTETVTLTANTDEGSPVVRYDAYVTPKVAVTFSADRTTIDAGESTTLRWDVVNAAKVELAPNFGVVNPTGAASVSPNTSTQYRLAVTSLDGVMTSSFVTVSVNPPPPVLQSAQVSFHTTDDNKDDDTSLGVYVICGGNTAASAGGTFGGEFRDNSDSGPYNLTVVAHPQKNQIGACVARLVESPNGHDEWHFNWTLILTFSDGSTRRYDWNGEEVDYDRTTREHGLS